MYNLHKEETNFHHQSGTEKKPGLIFQNQPSPSPSRQTEPYYFPCHRTFPFKLLILSTRNRTLINEGEASFRHQKSLRNPSFSRKSSKKTTKAGLNRAKF
ncbi:hypothetical protein CEXT_730101 [Caerostris extrusa]|uniref:Uncharacterized protein n=1 Tax=Caerostris extrusa TaxID=172846 RepID=A0AAV4N6M9_CAEEX|nr:hypothetical protein CEXT_730101 [Caerostris extrusa]